MPSFSKEVYFVSPIKGTLPLRKIFRVDATNRKEAKEILDKMVELYTKKLGGRKPIEDISKLKSVPRNVPEVSERTIQMLKSIFKTKS